MATVSDITTIPLSELNHIDALLDKGPDWNYFTPAVGAAADTLYYTFSVSSGNEDAQDAQQSFTGGLQAFNAAQQAVVRALLKDGGYLNQLTGIHFVETTSGTDAQIHLADVNLTGSDITGLCSWHSTYQYTGTQLVSYDADAYVYLDDAEWGSQNANLTPGGQGYQTLLHEMGHALGLKHPFDDGSEVNPIVLPSSENSTSNTLMSYTNVGGPYTQYQQYDVAALDWLYGGDGLQGALGINSTTGGRYIVGTNGADTLVGTTADDKLEGDGGNDMINGAGGNDTAVYRGVRSNYDISVLADGDLQVASKDGSDGTDTLHNISVLSFADMSVTSAAILAANTAPSVPTLAITENAAGYVAGSTPVVTGGADAGDTIKIYTVDNTLVGTTTADSTGLFSVALNAFSDGTHYQVYATATNSAGVTSAETALTSFNVDAHAPVAPTATLSLSSNVATFSGTGEAGTAIDLVVPGATVDDSVIIAHTTVASNGQWSVTTSPLPNGSYQVAAVSTDVADNSTSALTRMSFTVANPNNITGTSGNDQLTPTAANIAIDGGAGIDTVVVNGSSANYTVAKETWGYGLTDNVGGGGHDSLINVERVEFSNGFLALDVNGNAGEAYRLYQAAFGRPADSAGLGYWIWRMDNGASLTEVAHEFMTGQPEFDALYGSNPTDNDFINHLYENVLHREADAGGYAYWLNVLQTSPNARADVLTDFSESPENQALVIASIQNGMTYTPWHTT